MSVSGNPERAASRPPARDRQTKTRPTQWTKPRMALIRETDTGIACNCGWSKDHQRPKVLDDAADRHLKKRHGGEGIRF